MEIEEEGEIRTTKDIEGGESRHCNTNNQTSLMLIMVEEVDHSKRVVWSVIMKRERG